MKKKRPFQKRALHRALPAFLCLCIALFTGCTQNVIQERYPPDALPPINPYTGMVRDETITLYFRLADQMALVPEERTVRIGPRDNAAKIVINTLLEGPLAESTLLLSPFPRGTQVVDAVRKEDTVTVTLSKEFLESNAFPGKYTDARAVRRLGVYAIVNSLCTVEGVEHVQLLIDTDSSGIGVKLPPFLFGFTAEEISTSVLGPLERSEETTLAPSDMAAFTLTALVEQAYAQAYSYFSYGAGDVPDMQAFLLALQSRAQITGFTIREFQEDATGQCAFLLDLEWVTADQTARSVSNATLAARYEQGLYKIDYDDLLRLIQEAQ